MSVVRERQLPDDDGAAGDAEAAQHGQGLTNGAHVQVLEKYRTEMKIENDFYRSNWIMDNVLLLFYNQWVNYFTIQATIF